MDFKFVEAAEMMGGEWATPNHSDFWEFWITILSHFREVEFRKYPIIHSHENPPIRLIHSSFAPGHSVQTHSLTSTHCWVSNRKRNPSLIQAQETFHLFKVIPTKSLLKLSSTRHECWTPSKGSVEFWVSSRRVARRKSFSRQISCEQKVVDRLTVRPQHGSGQNDSSAQIKSPESKSSMGSIGNGLKGESRGLFAKSRNLEDGHWKRYSVKWFETSTSVEQWSFE